MSSETQRELVAACGLFCGQCHKYKKGKCPGCRENHKATWCQIRTCTAASSVHTCAECKDYADVQACRKFNNIFAKIFSVVFRSDRKASLQMITALGIENYAQEMNRQGRQVVKRH